MNRSVGNIIKIGLSLCLAASLSDTVAAQKDKPSKPSPKPKADSPAPPAYPKPPAVIYDKRDTSEKAISVDPNVSLKLCVAEGTLKINGWERDEVRIFVKDGRQFLFKVLEKNPDTKKPNWLWVVNAPTVPRTRGVAPNCLAGSSVQIDAPRKARIQLEARTAAVTVDSVHNLSVDMVEGNIAIRNIPGGVSASTKQGDVSIENSTGAITLDTTTGNILAFEIGPGEIGDVFKAKTQEGTISLQRVTHRQVQANSINGNVLFNGKFLNGGIYTFKTTSGAIRMLLPQETSCKLTANYGFGEFKPEFPVEVITEIKTEGGKNIVATIGEGEAATVNIITSSGRIGIRKQPK